MAKEIILYNLRALVDWAARIEKFYTAQNDGRSAGERAEGQPAKSNKIPVQLHWHFGCNQPRGLGEGQGEQSL